ncbi:ABC transporter permease subunit [Saccharospirillum mangrovi]|uniref:ABC transporter permease subunit n=1 Tax=Saccharospirillum mangrovi TaxID=2161747 RepID=UPI000D357AB5|nr:ABC transporter permease subunit [Saccharospirillum mangrovi]
MLLRSKKTAVLAESLANTEMAGRSLWKTAMLRFARNKAAMFSLFILLAVFLFAYVGPVFAQWDFDKVDWSAIGNPAVAGRPSIETGHYFGTDNEGRDLFARVALGSQISLMVGIIGAGIAVVIGTLYGAIAGYFGGRLDNLMMRFVDIMMSIPYMFFLILLLVAFGRSITLLFIGIGLISWMDMARIVRGQTLSLKNKEFIEAAVATGLGSMTIVRRHIVPNLMGVVVVFATLLVPQMILTESFISFLGLGVQEPMTSWGALIDQGSATMRYGTIWQLGYPLGFFIATLVSLFFIGDGLRDALDPKDR